MNIMQQIAIDAQRDKCRNLFVECLTRHPRFATKPEYTRWFYACELERSCHNAAIEECNRDHILADWNNNGFVNRYSALVAKYSENLDPLSSLKCSVLGDMMDDGVIKPNQVAQLTSRDINPLATAHEYAEISIRQEQHVDKKYSTRYRCQKCNSKNILVEDRQLGAIDEASHNRLQCDSCGNVWFMK